MQVATNNVKFGNQAQVMTFKRQTKPPQDTRRWHCEELAWDDQHLGIFLCKSYFQNTLSIIIKWVGTQ